MFTGMGLSFSLGSQKPLTVVDTEHGFVGNLKALRARILGIFCVGT